MIKKIDNDDMKVMKKMKTDATANENGGTRGQLSPLSGLSDRSNLEPKVNVRSIIDQFDDQSRKIKRKEVKLSPKSKTKLTPLRSTKFEKARKTLKLGKLSPKVGSVAKIGKSSKLGDAEIQSQIEPNKVETIVKAFEMNTKVSESTPNVSGIESKKFVANAFSRLMHSKGGGASPTSGKKKTKRLDKVKSTGLVKLDRWIVKEKP